MSNATKQVDVYDAEGNLIHEFDSISAASRYTGVKHCAILYRIKSGLVKDGMGFKFRNQEDIDSLNPYPYYKIKSMEDKELDRDKYKIIQYEVKYKRVSITPCPFKESPKPMVGSASCMECKSFKGRNRQKHEVACSRVNM